MHNGKPDGKWVATRTTFRQQDILGTELFEDGVFKQGSNTFGTYKDSSNINVHHGVYLPMMNAENFLFTNTTCSQYYGRTVMFARYPGGRSDRFASTIAQRLDKVLKSISPGPFDGVIEVKLKILEDGKVAYDRKTDLDSKLVSGVKSAIKGLPYFTPATIDGKAVEQNMIIAIQYNNGGYNFTYKMLPLTLVK